jgi:hypothetical protein
LALTKTINLIDWQDVTSAATGNPLAEQEILSTAQKGDLLVVEDEQHFVPVDRDGKWMLIPVSTEQDIAQWLNVPLNEIHRLLLEADIPFVAVQKGLLSERKLWQRETVTNRLEEYTAQKGISEREAALELGITRASYECLKGKIPFSSHDRVLKVLLEAYRNHFLPRNKVWSTRTSLLKEFVANYNRANADAPLELQYCDVEGCEHIASDQCINRACRLEQEPRFICPAHANWVNIANAARRPPSLCPDCAKAVQEGWLHGFMLL